MMKRVVGTIGILVCAIGFGLRANPVSAKVGESALFRWEHFVHWAGDFKCIEGDTLVRWPGNYQGVAIVPPEVRKIGAHAFISCKGVTGVKFMGPVKVIGREAFLFCDGLGEMAIPPTVALRSDSVQDLNGLKAAVKIAANGFARCDSGGEVMLAAMDAFAACRPALGVGADMVDVERCITMSGASKTVFCGTGGIDEIDIVFGTYEGGLVEVRMKMVDLKVSDIEFSETMKKGVRLGLESSGETPEEKVRKWL